MITDDEKIELTASEYIEMAARTESCENLTDPDRLCHAALGLMTELAEYNAAKDRVHRIEELGDAMWYIAIIARLQAQTNFDFLGTPPPADDQSIMTYVAVVADAAKRWKFYGAAPVWRDVNYALSYVYHGAVFGAYSNGISVNTLWASNIHKLRMRYPTKFTAEKAVTRDTDGEMSAVKKVVVVKKPEEGK